MNKICIELVNGKKMNVELYEDIAPITCENFLKLVDQHFFDGLVFHRIIKDFMCQAGGYYIKDNQYIAEKKAPTIVGEFSANGYKYNTLKHELGVISMARTNEPNSASSQFFLCVDNCHHLDNQYAGFGKITDEESLKVLKELNSLPTGMIDYSLSDWPNTDLENYTIKTIFRL